MHYRVIGCEVLARQLYYIAALAPHVIDIDLVAKGLHNEPDRLRAELQQRVLATDAAAYDAILLGYGLCSNSIVGVSHPRLPIVIPRAHDCITLYLGSAERYAAEFREVPGTYWYTPDYMERSTKGSDHSVGLGASGDDDQVQETYEEYVAKYGKDNADYLMEVMGAWKEHYTRAAYIDTADMTLPDYSEDARAVAERRGWTFSRLAGSIVILRDLVEGRWDAARYQVLEPGQTVQPSFDQRIICSALAAPCGPEPDRTAKKPRRVS